MKPRRLKWSPGDPNGAQEAQMEPRKPKWSPGGPNGTQEAKTHLTDKTCGNIFKLAVQHGWKATATGGSL